MATLEDFRADHLLLLVGTNPLPNLVAAELLLSPGGTVYLIHSRDTATVAKRLQLYLLRHKGYSVKIPQSVEEADPQDIKDKIDALLGRMKGSIGLNYTGGTKAMAVHAYRAVEHKCPNAVFSYLDAKTFEMRIDRPQWRDKVLLQVPLELKDLLNLHGAFFQKGFPKSPDDIVMLPVAQALARTAPDGGLCEWRRWCKNELRKKAHTGKGWKNKKCLQEITLTWPEAKRLAEAVVTLKRALGLPEDAASLPLDIAEITNWPFRKQDPKYLCQWLDGDWLEHYVLHSVASVANQLKLHDCAMNLKTDRNRSDMDLELDVAAMRGYQFFGISCTTSTDKYLAKSKLFEAYVRVRQLGGDEARVGLVAGWENPEKLESEVTRAWDAEGKIRVFGPQHLPDLADYLAQWFEAAS